MQGPYSFLEANLPKRVKQVIEEGGLLIQDAANILHISIKFNLLISTNCIPHTIISLIGIYM